MKKVQKFEFVPNPEELKDEPKYKIVMKWSHGDADLDTETSFEPEDLEEVEDAVSKLFEYRRFVPNVGWENLGYYECNRYDIPEWADKEDLLEYDRTSDGNCYAKLTEVTLYIDGVRQVILDLEARKLAPRISLPEIGSIINSNYGKLPASVSKSYKCGRDKIPPFIDEKNRVYTPFVGEVVEILLVNRYNSYDSYQIILYVKEYNAHVAIQIRGVAE